MSPSAEESQGIILPSRPMLMAGGIAALAAAGGGLAVLITLTAVGWITAPHVGIGGGLAGVLRSAGLLWLIAHHVQVTVRGVGPIGLLPLGLVLVPGALIERAGRWMTTAGHVTRLRHVSYAALAIACPYALFTAAVAVACRTPAAAPSLLQAVVAGFLLALLAAGLGAARGLAPWRRLAALVPPRPRSVIMGMLAALAVLTAFGAVLAGASLATHLSAYKAAVSSLSPGVGGAALLLLAGLSYLPNSVFWAIAYMLGPGFAFGVGTAVSPSGSALGAVPAFPMLAALPVGPKAAFPPWLGFFVLVMPYLAGALAGLMTVRIAPTPVLEAAPLWGLLTGSLAGVVIGFGAKFSGGPLGSGRLAAVGPAGAEVGPGRGPRGRRHRRAGGRCRQLADTAASHPTARRRLGGGPGTGGAPRCRCWRCRCPAAATHGLQVRGTGPLPVLVVDETEDAHHIYYDPWAADRDSDD